MTDNRRDFLKKSASIAAALSAGQPDGHSGASLHDRRRSELDVFRIARADGDSVDSSYGLDDGTIEPTAQFDCGHRPLIPVNS